MTPDQPAGPPQPPFPPTPAGPQPPAPAASQPPAPAEPIAPAGPFAGQPDMPSPAAMPQQPFAQQPMPSSPMRRGAGSSAKKAVTIVVILAIFGALGAGAYFVSQQGSGKDITVGSNTGTGTKTASSATSDTSKANADVVDRTDGKLDLSKPLDTTTSMKTQSLTAKVNQQVNLSDGHSYIVTGITRNLSGPSGSLAHPLAGKEFIKVSLAVGNNAQKGAYSFSDGDFEVKDSAGKLLLPYPISASEVPDLLKSQSIDPGKQISGSLVYQVSKDEKVSLTTHDEYSLIGQSGQRAIIGSEVTF